MKKHLSPPLNGPHKVSLISLKVRSVCKYYTWANRCTVLAYIKKISNPEDVLKVICFQSDMGCVTELRRICAAQQTRDYLDWRWPLFYVHSVIMIFSGVSMPTPNSFYLPLHSSYVAPSTPSPARLARYSYLPTQIEYISKDQCFKRQPDILYTNILYT